MKNLLLLLFIFLSPPSFCQVDEKIAILQTQYAPEHAELSKALQEEDEVDSESYPEGLKKLYWDIFSSYSQFLLGTSRQSGEELKQFYFYQDLLELLEYRDDEVNELVKKVQIHLNDLKESVYRFTKSLSISYMSWQAQAFLKDPTSSKTTLVLTNDGPCAGGSAGWENFRFYALVDGCLFVGRGTVSAISSAGIKYQQSDIPTQAVKLGPILGLKVSSTGARIGLGLPILYTKQDLERPKQQGYSVQEARSWSGLIALNSQWNFASWYVHTEFGKFLTEDEVLWKFGLGKKF